MSPLWRIDELRELYPGCELSEPVTGISIDTRTLEAGDLFVALESDRDGHEFLGAANEAGASGAMVHSDMATTLGTIRVDDTFEGLWSLGRAARTRTSAAVIAITGSSGKTTLRSWLEQLLCQVAATHASTGSLNNHWGVPLSLARMPEGSRFGVFEVGTNHSGEIAPLSQLVQPDVSILLNVLPAHIGNFASMEALIDEKLSITAGLHPSGTFIVPEVLRDRIVAPSFEVLSFGLGDSADVSGTTSYRDGVMSVMVTLPNGKRVECESPQLGEHRAESLLAVFAALFALKVDPSGLLSQIPKLPLPEGRGDIHVKRGIKLIDDSYNANPVSMELAVNSLAAEAGEGRRIALLGEMLELGDQTQASHEQLGSLIESLDVCYLFGDGFATTKGASDHFPSVADFDLDQFAGELTQGDVVLVKGSNKVFWKHNFTHRLLTAIGD